LLGGFGLWHGGVPVEGLNTPRLQSFVGYLLLHRDAAQSRRHLAFLFWPSSTEAQARTNLRKQIYYLHRALPDADRFVDTEGDVVQWRPDAPLQLDVAEFQQGLAEANAAGQRDDDKAERAALERAVAACSGDLLPDCYDDWVLAERERLRQQLAAALERLASLLQDRREYAAALAHARHLLRLDPLYEAACRQVMRLQAARGDRAAAIRTYQATAVVLEKELGVAPSAATTALYQQLLNREAAASRPAASPAFASPLVRHPGRWATPGLPERPGGHG
jgi:DNA-binding SARP family transcriptional activator